MATKTEKAKNRNIVLNEIGAQNRWVKLDELENLQLLGLSDRSVQAVIEWGQDLGLIHEKMNARMQAVYRLSPAGRDIYNMLQEMSMLHTSGAS